MLVTFDALTSVADEAVRPIAAQLLRKAAEACDDLARWKRLLRAAEAIAAGKPCAITTAGLAARQPAAVQTAAQAKSDEPPAPPGEETASHEDDGWPRMEEAPPPLPHLGVRHFFPELVVRVGRDFEDALGRPVCEGDVLKLLRAERAGGGYLLTFLECNIRLSAAHRDIIENAGNAWFQPVPSVACLEDLGDAIDVRLSEAAGQDSDGDYDDLRIERINSIRGDCAMCRDWLARSHSGPVPQPESGPLAGKVFGRTSDLAVWIPLFFAGVATAIPQA